MRFNCHNASSIMLRSNILLARQRRSYNGGKTSSICASINAIDDFLIKKEDLKISVLGSKFFGINNSLTCMKHTLKQSADDIKRDFFSIVSSS